MLFNLNETVRVRLTKKGKEILRAQHDAFITEFGMGLSEDAKKFTLPEEDKHGWSEWQMWRLFAAFGEHIYMGCDEPFSMTIEIPDKK